MMIYLDKTCVIPTRCVDVLVLFYFLEFYDFDNAKFVFFKGSRSSEGSSYFAQNHNS
jgi:phage terminase large subunit